jgi:hypothetical protein
LPPCCLSLLGGSYLEALGLVGARRSR